MSDIQEEFGDFTSEDALEEPFAIDLDTSSQLKELQQRFDEIRVIPDQAGRKIAAKLLIQELNGEPRGTVLAT